MSKCQNGIFFTTEHTDDTEPEHGNRRMSKCQNGIFLTMALERSVKIIFEENRRSRFIFLPTKYTNHTKRGNKPMRFGLKRKKENGFSFYALHQNQLLSEVLFSTAGLFLKPLPPLRAQRLSSVAGGANVLYHPFPSVIRGHRGSQRGIKPFRFQSEAEKRKRAFFLRSSSKSTSFRSAVFNSQICFRKTCSSCYLV